MYGNLDFEGTLEFFTRRYVTSLKEFFDISRCVVVDCASGYGWFSLAYLWEGGKCAVAIDIDRERLQAAKAIAQILGVADRIRFVHAGVQALPLRRGSVDLVVSIETLEHVGRAHVASSVRELCDVPRRGVLMTTPNKLFPVIAHDTGLPFLHWLPPRARRSIARLVRRAEQDDGNEFLSPFDLQPLAAKFERVSTCMTFKTYADYRGHYPFYLPYGVDSARRHRTRPSFAKALFYRVATAVFGRVTHWVMPSLAGVYVRRRSRLDL